MGHTAFILASSLAEPMPDGHERISFAPQSAPPQSQTLPHLAIPTRTSPWVDRWSRAVHQDVARSPAFRDAANAMAVHWRVVDMGLEPNTQRATEEKVVGLSLTAAGHGATQVMQAMLSKVPLVESARTLTRPKLTLGGDGARVTGADPDHLTMRAMADDTQRSKAREKSVALTTGLQLEDQAEGQGLGLGAGVNIRGMGLDFVRLQTGLSAPEGELLPTQRRSWGAMARQDLGETFTVQADIRSAEDGLQADRIRSWVTTRIPSAARWTVRTGVTRRPLDQEWRLELGLQMNLRWRAPMDLERRPTPTTQDPVAWAGL